jgi:DNA-binding NarL/FixJ family response regulator
LTAREHAVLTRILDGHGNSRIADELSISRRTVESHVTAILRKLEVTSRYEIIVWALNHGLRPAATSP